MRKTVGACVLAMFGLFAAVASAECVLTDMRTDVAPQGANGPVEVTAAFSIVDFLGVDDANQRIELDVNAYLAWDDPRLAPMVGCRFGVTEVWAPEIRLINSSNLRFALEFAVPVEIGGVVRLVADSENTIINDRLNVEGWEILGIALSEETRPLFDGSPPLSVLSLEIFAERAPNYYIFRILIPLMFVVAMSWVVFYVPPARYEFQIGLGATAMLTAIAFTLSIASQLPSLGYLTLMDKMLIWAVFLIFLTIVEALLSGILYQRENEAAALRLDRVCRFVFPVLLLGGWAYFAA